MSLEPGKVHECHLFFDFIDEDVNQDLYDFLEEPLEKKIKDLLGTKYKVELKYFKAKSVLRIHITRSEFDLIKDRRALSHQFNNVIDEFEQNYADKIIGWYEEGEEIFKEMHAS
jgi:hypothetical protein